MTIVLFSCCISLLTLFILLYRKKNNKKIPIPTWFLGSKYKLNFKQNVIFSKPPVLSFLLVILATLLAGYIYFPRNQSVNKNENKKFILIWLDPSLSANLSRMQNHFSAQDEAKKLNLLPYKIYGLSNDFLIQNGKPFIQYHIVDIASEQESAKFILQESLKPPSPFHQSLDFNQVSNLIQNYSEFKNKKGSFVVYSDGKESSLFGVFLLKKYFKDGSLIKSSPFYGVPTENLEIIPKDLAQEFSLSSRGLTAGSRQILMAPAVEPRGDTGEFTYYNASSDIIIPPYVRPQLFKTEYDFKNNKIAFIDQMQSKSSLPILFACTDILPSFIELDPFSSVRELAQFFNSTLVELKCQDKNSGVENLMRYRQGAIWIVPLTESVLSNLNNDFDFWVPKDFNINIDTLVYVAPSFIEDELFLQKTQVQIDQNSFPLMLNLAPLPPNTEILFKSSEDNLIYKGKFKLILKSDNEVPLAWKSQALPFFYLRTTVSSPNTSLGRSNKWIDFWFQVAKTVKKLDANFDSVELNDVNRINEEYPFEKNITNSLRVNDFQFEKAQTLTLGLYKLSDNKLLLLKNSLNNNDKIITEDEFISNFSLNSITEQPVEENEKQPVKIVVAFIIFALALLLLWFLQSRKNSHEK